MSNLNVQTGRGDAQEESGSALRAGAGAPETGNPALSKPWKLEKSFGGSDWKILYPDRRDASGFSILTFLPTAQTALAEFIVGAINDKIAARGSK